MARIEKKVTLVGEYSYERLNFGGYAYETVNIYKMKDDEGKVYVWKTTGSLVMETLLGNKGDEIREVDMYFPHRGDVIVIRATVKGESEYKGEPQTEVNRVKVIEIVSKYVKVKAEKQKKSVDLEEGDFIWKGMPYSQYKSHYSDCETVAGSYNSHQREDGTQMSQPTIDVIIRKGRLKNSGTRGEHYAYYTVINENGEKMTYKAISEDTAIKRARRELGGEWTVEDIKYRNCRGQYW